MSEEFCERLDAAISSGGEVGDSVPKRCSVLMDGAYLSIRSVRRDLGTDTIVADVVLLWAREGRLVGYTMEALLEPVEARAQTGAERWEVVGHGRAIVY